MSKLVYFLPGVTPQDLLPQGKWNQEILIERGLDGQLGDIRQPEASCAIQLLRKKTPDAEGREGTILQVTDGVAPRVSGYEPTQQQWHLRPAGFDVCVGIDMEEPVTPADLLRGKEPGFRGYAITLSDRQDWVVPILRSFMNRVDLGRSELPCDWTYGEDGKCQQEIAPRYRELWEQSGAAWDHWFQKDECPTIPFELLLDLGVGALGLNYRYGKIEQTVLKLMNSSNWEEFMRAILDLPFYDQLMESVKKNGAD